MTCVPDYKIPIDKSNKIAVSIHYFEPIDFTLGEYFDPIYWDDEDDFPEAYRPILKWGTSLD